MARLLELLMIASIAFAAPAFAGEWSFRADLTGDEEVPVPVDTDTTGEAEFEVNRDRTRIDFELEVEDGERILAGPGAHLHCGAFGENGPVILFIAGGVPVGFDGDVEISGSWNDGNIVNAACGATIADVVDSMIDGGTYVNVHSAANPAGEIRGQVEIEGRHDDDDDGDDDDDDEEEEDEDDDEEDEDDDEDDEDEDD